MRYWVFCTLALIINIIVHAGEVDKIMVNRHNLKMNFNLNGHRLEAVDHISLKTNNNLFRFLLNRNFTVSKISVQEKEAKFKKSQQFDWNLFGSNFEKDDSLFFARAALYQLKLKKGFIGLDSLEVSIHYQGNLYDTASTSKFSRSNITDQTIGIIGEEGIYLSPEAIYFPYINEEMTTYTVTAYTPRDYLTVTDGKLVGFFPEMDTLCSVWEGNTPTESVYFVAGKWDWLKDKEGETDIYGFFFPEDSVLSPQYMDAVKEYLQLYEGLIGKYPYPKFAVVENFFSTGYGMPSWTLLGQEVVRLPWIVSTSLGHELCHNYWGNGVFVDYKKGNWCEGLTTYCADYLYKDRKSSADAREYRMSINQDYTNYVNESNDFPLTDFREREGASTRSIGYGKSTMVFHILKLQVGEENFWNALQDFYQKYLFKKASWKDIQTIFEKHYRDDLGWFFHQWVDKKGATRLKLSDVRLDKIGDQFAVQLKVTQESDSILLKIPITLYYDGEEATKWFELTPGENVVSLGCSEKPSAVAVDPDFNVFRILDRDEYPSSLSEVLGAEKQAIILPTRGDPEKLIAYQDLVRTLNRGGEAQVLLDTLIKNSDLSQNSYLILGNASENALYKLWQDNGIQWKDWVLITNTDGNFSLMGESFPGSEVAYMITLRNPLNKYQSIAVYSATTANEIKRSGGKIIHYGKYSYLAFDTGKNKLKGNWEVKDSPLKWKL